MTAVYMTAVTMGLILVTTLVKGAEYDVSGFASASANDDATVVVAAFTTPSSVVNNPVVTNYAMPTQYDSGAAQPAQPAPCEECMKSACEGKHWPSCYAIGEVMFLKLGPPKHQSIVIDQNSQAGIVGTSDLGFSEQAGIKLSVGHYLDECTSVEAVYFGLQNWKSDGGSRGGNNNLSLPGDIGLALDDFFGADSMQVHYTGHLHNAEINVWHKTGDAAVTLMGGFRYINLVEKLNIHSIDSDADQSDYNIGAQNNLVGGQIGAQACMNFGNLGLSLVGKAGAFNNNARQTTSLFDNNNQFQIRNSSTTGNNFSFVGDLGLNGCVKLCDCLCLKGGYNVMWMTGIARATDQLDFTDTATSGTTLVHDGTVFLHGASLGFEACW